MQPSHIVSARQKLGITQEELATMSGVSAQTVSRIERGKPVRPDSVKAVCAALQMRYSPMEGIEVVASDRMRRHPSTDQMHHAARSLPGARFLVRPQGELSHRLARDLLKRMRLVALWKLLGLQELPWVLPMIPAWCFLAILPWYLTLSYPLPRHDVSYIIYTVLVICSVNISALFISLHIIIYTNNLLAPLFNPPDKSDLGIVVGTDAMWVMQVRGNALDVTRVNIMSGGVEAQSIGGGVATLSFRWREAHPTIEVVADHDGLLRQVGMLGVYAPRRSITLAGLNPV